MGHLPKGRRVTRPWRRGEALRSEALDLSFADLSFGLVGVLVFMLVCSGGSRGEAGGNRWEFATLALNMTGEAPQDLVRALQDAGWKVHPPPAGGGEVLRGILLSRPILGTPPLKGGAPRALADDLARKKGYAERWAIGGARDSKMGELGAVLQFLCQERNRP
jgi:hypothetical protein